MALFLGHGTHSLLHDPGDKCETEELMHCILLLVSSPVGLADFLLYNSCIICSVTVVRCILKIKFISSWLNKYIPI